MDQSPASHLPFGGSAFAEKTFAISYRPGAGWLPGKPLREQPLGPHRKYMQILANADRLLVAGPFLDDTGGIAFVRASDLPAAQAIAAGDPAVSDGIFAAEVRGWLAMFDRSRALETRLQAYDAAERNAQVVLRLFEAVERRDREALLRAYDEAIAIHEAPSLPYGGDYVGVDGALRHASGYRSVWDRLQGANDRPLDPEVIAQGERVAVVWHQRARDRASNALLDMPVVSVYRMKDGRIVDARMFHFDAAASREFLERAGRRLP